MDNNKRNAIIITLVISTAFTLTACGDKPSSNSSFSDSDSSYSASVDIINNNINDDSIPIDQPVITTATTKSDSKQPSATPQTTTPKTSTKSPVTTTKSQAVISPPVTTQVPAKKLIVPTAAQCQVIENEIIRLVNQYRASKGLYALTVENKLMQAAGIRAEEASRPNCYCHNRPDGSKLEYSFNRCTVW